MRANIGMQYAVAAPITAYTPYTSITYDDGFFVAESKGANISWETEDGEFRGDDILLDAANGALGYTIDFESAGIANAVRAKLLGETKDTNDAYHMTGASAPDVGFGFVAVMRDDTSGTVVTSYEGYWFHKVKFGLPNDAFKTKEKNIDWQAQTISGKGMGVFLAAAQADPDFGEHKTFATLALAKAWLNSLADISG